MFVIAILGTVAGMAMMVSPAFARHARAEGGAAQVIDVMRLAREAAISHRRNVEVLFIGLNALQTRRIDIGANGAVTGTTILRTVELENGVQFRLESGVPDTPDLFGMASATDFDLVGPWMFTSEGTFIGGSGDVTNGTVFLSIPNQPNSCPRGYGDGGDGAHPGVALGRPGVGGVDVMDKNESGFSLIEVMIAMSLLATGLLSLAGVFVLGLPHLAGSSAALIAREKARETVESVHTARDTRVIRWCQIYNVGSARNAACANELRACFLRGCSLSEAPDPTVL